MAESGVLVHNSYPTGFHGTSAKRILSIIERGGLEPKNGKVFLSKNNDVFLYGTPEGSNVSYSLELEYAAGNAKVVNKSITGLHPRAVVIETDELVPVTAKRLHIRTALENGEFSFQVIEGIAEIVRFLTP